MKLSHELMKLALAVSRKRTSVYYGTNQYCTIHNQLTDAAHIDECEAIKVTEGNTSDITAVLDDVDSLWDLEQGKLVLLVSQLKMLNERITDLVN